MRFPRAACLGLVLCLSPVPEVAAERTAPEKIPPDKVIHPLLKGVTQPRLIPESRTEPVYPERWREHRIGGRVILQAVIEKSGSVGTTHPLACRLGVETECPPESGDTPGGRNREPDTNEPAGTEGSGSREPTVPVEACRDFEAAAIRAVKQWKYKPGRMNDVPVDVFFTIIVEFTTCPVVSPQGP